MSEVGSSYASISEVADYFKVGISTIRKWIYSGHIPDHAYINIGVT